MTNHIFYFLQRSSFKILYGTCEIYIYTYIYLFIYIASLYNSFITIISIKSMYSVVVIPKYQRKQSLCATWKTNTKRLMVTKNETRFKSKPEQTRIRNSILKWNSIDRMYLSQYTFESVEYNWSSNSHYRSDTSHSFSYEKSYEESKSFRWKNIKSPISQATVASTVRWTTTKTGVARATLYTRNLTNQWSLNQFLSSLQSRRMWLKFLLTTLGTG